eukprot:TRINITY_DN7242_c4_g1_i1.p1 TRINITY_DN7242_c4_g1~~TRINITY_DN7242_c4_g1_i1.p1  ORF type:complete len:523 (+),score=106.73 TRINITY_DN7242_c4_g1_i1:40-1569(+)
MTAGQPVAAENPYTAPPGPVHVPAPLPPGTSTAGYPPPPGTGGAVMSPTGVPPASGVPPPIGVPPPMGVPPAASSPYGSPNSSMVSSAPYSPTSHAMNSSTHMPSAVATPMNKMQRLETVLSEFEITIADANDLVLLEDYEIVFVADDSGSMSISSIPVSERKLGQPNPSRWDELKNTMYQIIELACIFDEDGVDVYFLNRPHVRGIRSRDDPNLMAALQEKPSGTTPLTETLLEVMQDYNDKEKPVLVIIATDGEPNGGPAPFVSVITKAIKTLPTPFKFQIMACTDDDDQVGWLNTFDDLLDEVDVTDDYISERREVLAAGRCTQFKRSDWVIKALLGPISRKFDAWDEPLPQPVRNQPTTVPVVVHVAPQQSQMVAKPPTATLTVTSTPSTGFAPKSGFLEKFSCGNKFSIVKNWKQRFIRHTRDGLSYYKNDRDANPQGTIPYNATVKLFVNVDTSIHPNAVYDSRFHYFAIQFGIGKQLLLRARSAADKDAWCRAILQCVSRGN